MCIFYSIEFWTPTANPSADWKRCVRRGLERPGTNRAARVISFYDCRGRLYTRPQCDRNTIRDGGTIGNRIAEFCASDTDCAFRMRHFQNACSAARRRARQAERERWSADRQEAANREWRQAYDDWQSARYHHQDCPATRGNHRTYRRLISDGVMREESRIADAQRLGRDPNAQPEPIQGIPRQHDEPKRRY